MNAGKTNEHEKDQIGTAAIVAVLIVGITLGSVSLVGFVIVADWYCTNYGPDYSNSSSSSLVVPCQTLIVIPGLIVSAGIGLFSTRSMIELLERRRAR